MFTHMDVHNERPDSTAVTADVVNCTNSFVRVQDGEDADAPVIGTYCLTRIPPAITSQVRMNMRTLNMVKLHSVIYRAPLCLYIC